MIRAALFVQFPADNPSTGNPRGENWGEFYFGVLPSPGDYIHLIRDGVDQSVIARRIDHIPLPKHERTCFFRRSDRRPVQQVIADWHWSEEQ